MLLCTQQDETGLRVDGPAGVQALETMVDWVHGPRPVAPPPQFPGGWFGFRQGKMTRITHGISMLNELKRLPEFDLGTFPIPRFFATAATRASCHLLAVKGDIGERHRRAAFESVRYLSGHGLTWGPESGQLPVRKSIRGVRVPRRIVRTDWNGPDIRQRRRIRLVDKPTGPLPAELLCDDTAEV